ncbi:MAG: DUF1801 domain-containing protein [Gemmatimonadales bacterium]
MPRARQSTRAKPRAGELTRAEITRLRQAYVAGHPPIAKRALGRLRSLIRAAQPEASEFFSYRMPAFRLYDRPLVWYAAFKHHVSLFPMTPSVRRPFEKALATYRTAKGTVQFPLDQPLPARLIQQLVNARAKELRRKARA